MVFDTNKKRVSRCTKSVNVYEQPIEKVTNISFLGITLNQDLSWKPHMLNILNKIRRNFGVIMKIKQYLNTSNLICLYYAMIESNLRYCAPVWQNGNEGLIKKMQKVCNKYTRILNISDEKCKHNPLSVENLGILETGIFMFKMHNGLLPKCLSTLYQYINSIHNKQTRLNNHLGLYTPFFSKSITQHSIQFVGTKLWNNLPDEIKEIKNMARFSKKLKNHLCKTN